VDILGGATSDTREECSGVAPFSFSAVVTGKLCISSR
jgi:hypothetical protein